MITFCEQKTLTYQQLQDHLDLLDESYFFELSHCLEKGDLGAALLMLEEAIKDGVDLQQWMLSWSEVLRDALLVKDLKTSALLHLGPDQFGSYQQASQALSEEFLLHSLNLLNQAAQSYKESQYPRLHLELMLYRIGKRSNHPEQVAADTGAEKKKP